MKTCPNCHYAENFDGNRNCKNCGQSFSSSSARIVTKPQTYQINYKSQSIYKFGAIALIVLLLIDFGLFLGMKSSDSNSIFSFNSGVSEITREQGIGMVFFPQSDTARFRSCQASMVLNLKLVNIFEILF